MISLLDRQLPEWLRKKYKTEGIIHYEFKIQDDELVDILEILGKACDVIEQNIERSGILVHCGLGISRSGSVMVGFCE